MCGSHCPMTPNKHPNICNTRAPQVHHKPSKQHFTVPVKPTRTFNITLTETLSTQSIRGPLNKPSLLLNPIISSH